MKRAIFLLFIVASLAKSEILSITGVVVSDNQKMIGARYMGYVKKINFEIGDYVKREDTLFELESAEFDILKNQAELALEQAEIMVDMYRTRMDSIKRERRILDRMRKKGSDRGIDIDQDSLDTLADNTAAGLAAAQALVKSAAIKVKQVATISDYLEIKAPNDGIIVKKNIRVGDLVYPGMLTMLLVDLKHLEIEAQIAESDLSKIKEGQKVDITIPSMKHHTTGVVKSIVPSANPMAHTFTARISLPRTKKRIFPGMYAKLKIKY
jgi:RND family efflux transporter MFP subunit